MYEEERAVGNEFEVDVSLSIKAPKDKIKSLQDTVNYAEVYRITKELFSTRRPLLETLAMEIAEALKEQFSEIREISIAIKKLKPPIIGFTGYVGVTYERSYK